jgi:hypothetical protein
MEASTETPWYLNLKFVIAAAILFPPLGLILLWMRSDTESGTKVFGSVGIREGYEVGVAQGLRPGKVLGVEAAALADPERADEALATAMEGHGATYASMLQDLERGAATEVDVIDGAVVERGQECGIPTPLHERVTKLIHAAERGEIRPSPNALRDLRLAGAGKQEEKDLEVNQVHVIRQPAP